MDFDEALKRMREGHKVRRNDWPQGVFIFIIAENAWGFETDVAGVDDLDTSAFICLKTVSDRLMPWRESSVDSCRLWSVVGEEV